MIISLQLLYFVVLLLGELSWQVIGVMWLARYYQSPKCFSETHKKASLGKFIVLDWYIVPLKIIKSLQAQTAIFEIVVEECSYVFLKIFFNVFLVFI